MWIYDAKVDTFLNLNQAQSIEFTKSDSIIIQFDARRYVIDKGTWSEDSIKILDKILTQAVINTVRGGHT